MTCGCRVIGGREGLASDIPALLTEAEELTQNNRGLTLIVAFNYGGRQEIAAAARRLAREAAAGVLSPDAIDEAMFEADLDTADIPDPDLIIRTSGEQRLSNFLLWQAAYAEFVFSADPLAGFRQSGIPDGSGSLCYARASFRRAPKAEGGRGEVRLLKQGVMTIRARGEASFGRAAGR